MARATKRIPSSSSPAGYNQPAPKNKAGSIDHSTLPAETVVGSSCLVWGQDVVGFDHLRRRKRIVIDRRPRVAGSGIMDRARDQSASKRALRLERSVDAKP